MKLFLVAALAVLFAAPGSAARRATSSIGPVTGEAQIGQNPVEQQTQGFYGPCVDPALPGWCQPDQSQWVLNNTGCIWDHDDYARKQATGNLAPGESYTLAQCIIADWDQHFTGPGHQVRGGVNGPAGLAVTVCVSPGGCVPVNVVQTGPKTWSYGACVNVYAAPDDPGLEPIPGSNGGVGVPTEYTIKVTNPSPNKAARDVTVSYTVGDDLFPVQC